MTLSIQDPIYQNTVWQAPATEPAQLAEQIADLHTRSIAWQQCDESERIQDITAWQQAIQQAEHLPAKLCTYCGMTPQHSQAWLQAITTVQPAPAVSSGVVVIVNDSVEPAVWSTLWHCLTTGSAVLLVNAGPMAAIAAELVALCPEALPVSSVAVAELVQPVWQQAGIAALHCFSNVVTARAVHESLAGRFDLPAYFHTPLCHQVLLAPEAEVDTALDCILSQALMCSGQYFNAVRQIIVCQAQYANIIKQLTAKLKSLRVAAYDAKPQPDLSSLSSIDLADQVYQDFLALRKLADTKVHLPVRKLLNGTGMLTPGLIEVPLNRLAQVSLTCGPMLQLVVIDDLTQVAEVCRKTNRPGNFYVCDANQNTINKLKLVLRHTPVQAFPLG